MKVGIKSLNELLEKEKSVLLQKIIDDCIAYSGDSYEDFGRSTLRSLKNYKLVDYGE